MTTAWRLGTIGFSYDDWAEPFYPAGMKPADRLTFYAQFFNAVELDTTFHGVPAPGRMKKWADAVPDDFRICAKAPREATYDPATPTAPDALKRFIDAAREMGPKLGVLLLQFPPNFTADRFGDLENVLKGLPEDVRFSVELRHRSWGKRETLELLKTHRCAFVSAEYLVRPARILATTDFLYCRVIGQHGRFPSHERQQADPTEGLTWWARELTRRAADVKSVYAFANNDYAGYAIETCNRLKELIGLPVKAPTRADRGQLFG